MLLPSGALPAVLGVCGRGQAGRTYPGTKPNPQQNVHQTLALWQPCALGEAVRVRLLLWLHPGTKCMQGIWLWLL